MKGLATALVLVATAAFGSSTAFAQDAKPATEGRAVVTIIPGGATFLTEGKNSTGPSFGNYNLGGAVVGNFNKYVGVEGEVLSSIGITQTLTGFANNTKTPNSLSYTGNLVVSFPAGKGVVPYVTGGAGATSVFETTDLGIIGNQTFFTSNVGGGLKWYAGSWGLRVDYRFIAVQGKDDAPAFFGPENRYAHRIYGGFLVNIGR